MFQIVPRRLFSLSARPTLVGTGETARGAISWKQHLAVILLALVGIGWAFKPWKLDPHLPLAYGHDAMSVLLWTKSVVDEGWWLSNHYVGAPDRLDMHDYPTSSNVHFLALKLLSKFTRDPFQLVTLYYFLTFPLAAWSGFYVMRKMGLAFGNSLVCSVLFAFTYFHFNRGTSHLFLSAYQFVPLMCLVWVWLIEDRPYLVGRNPSGRLRPLWHDSRTWGTLLILAAVASDFPYIPLFALLMLVPVGIYTVSLSPSRERVLFVVAVGGLLALGFGLNLAPTFLYRLKHGPNVSTELTAVRPWTDGEEFGLKLIQLLLPSPDQPNAKMRAMRTEYYSKTQSPSESDSMSMGLAASVGLLWLAISLFRHAGASDAERKLRLLSLLAVAAFLIGVNGGVGGIMNFLSLPSARCYNRISIFIVFFSLSALAFLLQPLSERRSGSIFSMAGSIAVPTLILFLGMYDQVGNVRKRDWQGEFRASFESDREFVRRVETRLPREAMVFQLPEVTWLSYRNHRERMLPYDHLRGYLHSRRLRWSYGAMCGRETAIRHHLIAELPLEKSVETMATMGFDGIYVDRLGYADPGREVETPLRKLLGVEPIESRDHRLLFFSLVEYKNRPEFIAAESRRITEMVTLFDAPRVGWVRGTHVEELDATGKPFRWCLETGTLTVENRLKREAPAKLRFGTMTLSPGQYTVTIRAGGIVKNFPVTAMPTRHEMELTLPPGTTTVTWLSNAPRGPVAERPLHFKFSDLKCEWSSDPDGGTRD